MAGELRPVQRATQGPQPRSVGQIAAARVAAWMLDWPYRSGTVLAALFIWWTVSWWAGVIVLAVGAVICWYLRGVERDRAARRRFVRAWRGTPERPGLAHDLDLVNRSGIVPNVTQYLVDDLAGQRTISFALPAGITSGMFDKQREVIADALGAHRAEVQPVSPGRLDFVVFDRDALAETVSADWARGVEPAVPEVPETPPIGEAVPYWLTDDDEDDRR